MKASELRIGNWVKGAFDCEIQVTASGILNFFHGMNDLEPIPLTEEWLLKFGFKDVSEKYPEYQLHGYFARNFGYCGWELARDDGEYYLTRLADTKYVHQLQNLYHALCGHELKTKQDDK